ncbi:MAG: LysM peptidoglycan-binding domain-containing protein [bacterium]|nr:LysM peptidoglycan-binding domain-containing protein [Candidatus Kapabacteria bacterium]
MGLFDKIFGRGASKTVAQPTAQQKFDTLRQKYLTALTVADKQGVRLTTLQLQNDKLYFRGVAPSDQAKTAVLDQIKIVDADNSDVTADIFVQNATPSAFGSDESKGKTYTVKSGDSLSKISKEFYGDSDEYMRIFYANRDKINDPDKIQIGQELAIPVDDDN